MSCWFKLVPNIYIYMYTHDICNYVVNHLRVHVHTFAIFINNVYCPEEMVFVAINASIIDDVQSETLLQAFPLIITPSSYGSYLNTTRVETSVAESEILTCI